RGREGLHVIRLHRQTRALAEPGRNRFHSCREFPPACQLALVDEVNKAEHQFLGDGVGFRLMMRHAVHAPTPRTRDAFRIGRYGVFRRRKRFPSRVNREQGLIASRFSRSLYSEEWFTPCGRLPASPTKFLPSCKSSSIL